MAGRWVPTFPNATYLFAGEEWEFWRSEHGSAPESKVESIATDGNDIMRMVTMWFICLRHALQPREQWTTPLDEHLAWMKTQHDRGKILMSGPGTTSEGDRVGIYLIRADSRGEAEQVAAADPFTVAGHCAFSLIVWEIHQIMGAGPFMGSLLHAMASAQGGQSG